MTIGWTVIVDGLAQVMLGLIVVVGVAVMLHLRRSLHGAVQRRVTWLLTSFAAAMALLVISDDLLLLYLAWEATSVLSYLLIGTKDTVAGAREAARRALFTTAAGGLCLLVGFIIVMQATGQRTLSGVVEAGVDGTAGQTAAVLILLGALTKSAQVPFHRWLPGAMAAPAPVSAYLHSATMVKAGIYLVLRLSPAFADVAVWDALILSSAGTAVLVGGWRALRSTDLKAMLAWSTVGQLGLIMLVVSASADKAVLAGTGLIVAHALAKAALFLSVGTIEVAAGTRELGALAGLGRQHRGLGLTITVALTSLAGVAPLFGFITKEGALVGLLDGGEPLRAGLVVTGSILTAAYGSRVLTTIWTQTSDPVPWTRPHAAMLLAPGALVAPLVVLGVIWPLGNAVAALGAAAVGAEVTSSLVLWPGLNLALGLSVGALLVGVAVGRTRIGPAVGEPVDLAGWLLEMPARAGRAVVLVLRPGHLPTTVGLMLAAVSVLTLGSLVGSTVLSDALRALPITGGWLHAMAAAAIVAGAIGAAGRVAFPAVLSLGVVGFAMAGYFVLVNAPDLALTQVLVETIIVLGFLAVLRARRTPGPATSARAPRAGWRVRALVSVGAAGAAGALAIATTQQGRISRAGEEIVARAYPDGAGRNVVNVILTDIRALDTLGEVAVVGLAAVGVMRLFQLSRSEGVPS